MYIEDENAPTRNLKIPGMDDPIDIEENAATQVTEDVGELLIERCPTITEHE